RQLRRAADAFAAGAGGGDPFPCTLNEEVAFELGNAAHYREHEFALWGRRIQLEVGDVEMDAALTQGMSFVERVPRAAESTVERPHHHHDAPLQTGRDTQIDRPMRGDSRKGLHMELVGHGPEPR